MFWLISEPQATLPDISEAFYLKPCLNSHLQTMQPENLHLWMLIEVFSKCRMLFVLGFQGGFYFLCFFFFLPALQTDAALGTLCAEHRAERKPAA